MTVEFISESMVHQQCISCGVHWMMPAYLDNQRKKNKERFYCPNGHGQAYVESEADRLRRERDRLAQQIAQRDDEIKRQRERREETERRLAATKGVVTRYRNRVGSGVCPCCNRTFHNLARHMASQHPTFAAEAAE